MDRHTRFRTLVALAACALLVTACKTGGSASRGSATVGKPPGQLADAKRASAKSLKAADGGMLRVKAADGTFAEIYFPPGSLKVDTQVEVVPLTGSPISDGAGLGLGVFVRSKGGRPVVLVGPAVLRVLVKGRTSAKAGLVRLGDDGRTYTPVATDVRSDGKVTELVAVVDTFSAYVPRTFTDGEAKAASKGPRITSAWVVSVNDTRQKSVEMWKFTYTLNMEARGSSPFGTFSGPMAMTLTGKADQTLAKLVKVNLDVNGTAKGTAKLQVLPPLAPLVDTTVPPDAATQPSPDLEPLVPSTDYGWVVGEGTAQMQDTGVLSGMGSGPGLSVTVNPMKGTSSETVPFTVGIRDGSVWIIIKGVNFKGRLIPIYAKKR